jgi:hypothetical protein
MQYSFVGANRRFALFIAAQVFEPATLNPDAAYSAIEAKIESIAKGREL